jgi:osmotically-inducible protein OsmY
MPNDRRYERPYARPGGYQQFDDEWRNDDASEQYFGAGSHYGGGFGTAPSSRASSRGSAGASGYANEGAFSDPADWTPETESLRDAPSHRGRGPKGYTRSDERLLETICQRLTDDPRIDASDIEVEVKDQVATLRGSVEDRRTKYQVEELIDACGVREIHNQLRVNQRRW